MKCMLCGMEFKTLEELETHLKTKHSIHYNSYIVQEQLRLLKIKEEMKVKKESKTKSRSKRRKRK